MTVNTTRLIYELSRLQVQTTAIRHTHHCNLTMFQATGYVLSALHATCNIAVMTAFGQEETSVKLMQTVQNIIYWYENTHKYYAAVANDDNDEAAAWWEVLMEPTTATKQEVGWAAQPVRTLWRRESLTLPGTEKWLLVHFKM